MHADDRAERPEDQSELNFEPASSQDPKRDRYVALAEKLLGYEPQTEPLYLPRMDYSNPDADADINPVSNIADLTDSDDQRLCELLRVDRRQWPGLNLERRIAIMESLVGDKNNQITAIDIDLPSMTVKLDGSHLNCSSKQALRWLKVLADHPNEWISAPDLEQYDPELIGVRTDRLKSKLPKAIMEILETDRRKGSRLVLAADIKRPY